MYEKIFCTYLVIFSIICLYYLFDIHSKFDSLFKSFTLVTEEFYKMRDEIKKNIRKKPGRKPKKKKTAEMQEYISKLKNEKLL